MCHLYARATKIVSRPAPVYLAHRAAFLAQYYTSGYQEDDGRWETGSTASAGSDESSFSTATVGSKMTDTIYYA